MNIVAKLSGSSLARWAACLAILVGVVLLARGTQQLATRASTPMPLSFALVTIGALELILSWLVLQRSRAAWSFLTSLNGTMFVVALFGAPKLRDSLEIPITAALIPCLIFGTVCLLASLGHDDF